MTQLGVVLTYLGSCCPYCLVYT
nr:unnamed protein product [Callosobruchus chinensis]